MRHSNIWRGALCALVAVSLVTPAAATEQAITQATLRAAFLYTFAKFTEWPQDGSAGALTLCVLGDAAIAEGLEQVTAGRSSAGHELLITRPAPGPGLRSCHLLYVAGDDPAAATRVFDMLAGVPVLTVGEGERFVRAGGVVGLFIEDGRMRFVINPDAAQRAGVRLSSKLLSLAKIVRDEHHGQS